MLMEWIFIMNLRLQINSHSPRQKTIFWPVYHGVVYRSFFLIPLVSWSCSRNYFILKTDTTPLPKRLTNYFFNFSNSLFEVFTKYFDISLDHSSKDCFVSGSNSTFLSNYYVNLVNSPKWYFFPSLLVCIHTGNLPGKVIIRGSLNPRTPCKLPKQW